MNRVLFQRKRLLLRLSIALALICIGLIAAVGLKINDFVNETRAGLPDVQTVKNFKLNIPSTIYSADGLVIGELFDEKRYPVKISEVSSKLVDSFLAAEDSNYYSHSGIDYTGIIRAGLHYVFARGGKQGGSTITQQLAKNLLLTRERTLSRKLKDMMLAVEIEKILTKDEILELYLNTIFLGNNSYGVEAAARNYFRKKASELNLAESSLIAGLAPAPSTYAPTTNYKAAKKRQKYVLNQLVGLGKITEDEALEAFNEDLEVFRAEAPNTKVAPYFLMEVKKQLEGLIDRAELESGGYKIYSTIHAGLQAQADSIVTQYMKQYEDKKGFKGPISRSGADFESSLVEMLAKPVNLENEALQAIVVDLNPNLDIALVVSQIGLGVLLADDHRWALRTGQDKESEVLDFAHILRVGDVVHVKLLERKTPRRIHENASQLTGLNDYLPYFLNGTSYEGVRFYSLSDVEQIEASVLLIDSQTGGVRVMVGGSDFSGSQFNRATQAKRQVGSSIKPLYYSYAFDQGFGLSSKLDSPPIVIGDWKPENYSRKFLGRTTLRSAMINSYNIPSIQLFQALGMDAVAEHVKRLGVDFPPRDLSAALGSGGATLLELTQAYSPFVNQGEIKETRYIDRIEDRSGKLIFDAADKRLVVSPVVSGNTGGSDEGQAEPVLTQEAAYLSLSMLEDVVTFGTGSNARISGVKVAGKTGTTNGYTDAWFMGMTPGILCGIWIGFDDAQKSLGVSGTGGKMAAPLWRQIILKALPEYGQQTWVKPEGIRYMRIDPETGNPAKGDGGVDIPVAVGFEAGSQSLRNALGMYGIESGSGSEVSEDRTEQLDSDETSRNLRSLF